MQHTIYIIYAPSSLWVIISGPRESYAPPLMLILPPWCGLNLASFDALGQGADHAPPLWPRQRFGAHVLQLWPLGRVRGFRPTLMVPRWCGLTLASFDALGQGVVWATPLLCGLGQGLKLTFFNCGSTVKVWSSGSSCGCSLRHFVEAADHTKH